MHVENRKVKEIKRETPKGIRKIKRNNKEIIDKNSWPTGMKERWIKSEKRKNKRINKEMKQTKEGKKEKKKKDSKKKVK